MASIKSSIYYMRRVKGTEEQFLRLSVYPKDKQHGELLKLLNSAGFTSSGREQWLRRRKAYDARKKVKK